MNYYLIGTYVLYSAIAVGLTAWLAKTLFSNGAVFLADVFEDRDDLANAVNRLLVVGFYLLNLGYAFLILRADAAPGALAAVETLVAKLGLLLVSLGVLHFANMYLFYRIRRRAQAPEPPAQQYWAPQPYPPGPGPQPQPMN